MRGRLPLVVGLFGGLLALVVTAGMDPAIAAAIAAKEPSSDGITSRVSVSSTGGQTDHWSTRPALSADGRFVAFYSRATNLVPDDTNRRMDVFVRNLATGVTQRVSVSSQGRQGNGQSYDPSLSMHGRYVTFTSAATQLVAHDTNDAADVFVRDLATGRTHRVSVPTGGAQAVGGDTYEPTLSSDGRFVAFVSDTTNMASGTTNRAFDIYVRDRWHGQTRRLSVSPGGAAGNDDSTAPAFSQDGRFVTFLSFASNLVAGDTNSNRDVFVRDRLTKTTERVSVSSWGEQANSDDYDAAISAHGRYIAFSSSATNLVSGDTNSQPDVFVRDRQLGLTRRVSIGTDGRQSDGQSFDPSISALGQYVTYYSYASNLVTGDTNGHADVFVRNRFAGRTLRVSVNSGGGEGNEGSYEPAISADGEFVAFESLASNLVAKDKNHRTDVFVYRR